MVAWGTVTCGVSCERSGTKNVKPNAYEKGSFKKTRIVATAVSQQAQQYLRDGWLFVVVCG